MALVAMAFCSVTCQSIASGGEAGGKPEESASGVDKNVLEELSKLERRQEITEGGFREVEIGQTKDQVIKALLALGAHRVVPDLTDVGEITQPEDLATLRDAEGLIVGSGAVVIEFDGDEVQRLWIVPTRTKWQAALHGARTRSEVFLALAQLLAGPDAHPVRRFAADARSIYISKLTPQGHAILEKYDLWRVSHVEADGGYLHLTLEFERGLLVKISVYETPAPN